MQKVACDLPKSKGGINYVDLLVLAKKRGIAVPKKILKRDLCKLINDDTSAVFSAISSRPDTIKSTKINEATIDPKKDIGKLPKLESLYTIKKALGAGSFGEVWQAIDKKTGEEVALKLLHSLTDSSKREVAILINVSKIYRNSCSINILCYKDQFAAQYGRRFEVIVTEFVDGVSLDKWIVNKGPASTSLVKKWTRQLLSALKLCHSHGISHMDVKPANIMIRNDNDDLVLIDFGLSCNEKAAKTQVDNCNNQGGGTLVYMSPDYLKACVLPPGLSKDCDETIRQNTDNWAAAITMLDAATKNKYMIGLTKIGEATQFFKDERANGDEFIAQLGEFIRNNPPATGDASLDKTLQLNLDKGGL